MLQDLDKTFEKILVNEGKIVKSDIDISFEPPTSEWSSRLNRPTLSMFCFDMRENLKLRSGEMRVRDNGNMKHTYLPQRRIDVSYLVTAWARKIEDEHRLIWRSLTVLKKFSVLRPSECEGALRYSEQDIPLWVADVGEGRFNITDLWSVLDNQMRLGYVVTATLELDTEAGFDSPPVLEATISVGQREPSQNEISALDTKLKIPKTSPEEGGDSKDKNDKK